MTATLTKDFGDNVAAREDHFMSWFAVQFGEKAAARAASLETAQRDLSGRTMMEAVRSSDAGMETVMNMLTPSRGA